MVTVTLYGLPESDSIRNKERFKKYLAVLLSAIKEKLTEHPVLAVDGEDIHFFPVACYEWSQEAGDDLHRTLYVAIDFSNEYSQISVKNADIKKLGKEITAEAETFGNNCFPYGGRVVVGINKPSKTRLKFSREDLV